MACLTKTGLSKRAFEKVFSDGARVHGRYCRLIFLPGEGRIGFAVPKKIGCHARRNRLKRRLREAVRNSGALLPASVDVVISANLSAEEVVFAEFKTDVAETISKAASRWESELASS